MKKNRLTVIFILTKNDLYCSVNFFKNNLENRLQTSKEFKQVKSNDIFRK